MSQPDNRFKQTVKLGNTEEWTVINTSQRYHSFFLVMESERYGSSLFSVLTAHTEEGHSVHRSDDCRSFRYHSHAAIMNTRG